MNYTPAFRFGSVTKYFRYWSYGTGGTALVSDDGWTFNGAYGPPFADQAGWIARAIAADPATRQAVMTIWRPRPVPSADIPCTVALQWLYRSDELNCVAFMRSSDAWLGIPYDWMTFSMMSADIALLLKWRGCLKTPRLGQLTVIAGSQHLYKLDWDDALKCSESSEHLFEEKPLDLYEFTDPQDLIGHLWAIARKDGTARHEWLKELL